MSDSTPLNPSKVSAEGGGNPPGRVISVVQATYADRTVMFCHGRDFALVDLWCQESARSMPDMAFEARPIAKAVSMSLCGRDALHRRQFRLKLPTLSRGGE